MNQRTSEAAFHAAIAAYLWDSGGEATISEIRRKIPAYLTLQPADRALSASRPGEEVWEQQVRNIVCHRDCDGNPIKAGKLRYSRRRLALAVLSQGDLFG